MDFDVERIYEDEDILVLDKPSFVVVHDAPSVKVPTLVDWLKQSGISLSTISGEERHGIVHRLDKETSGLMVVAKNNSAHKELSRQLAAKEMGRYYLALIDLPLKENCIIERPLGRNPKNRLKMGITKDGRAAKSAFCKLTQSMDGKTELIGAKLYSGRTHQIRAHLESLNRHILGDSLYGFKSLQDTIPRVFLHAYCLYLTHPRLKKEMFFSQSPSEDMMAFMQKRFEMEYVYESIDKDSFASRFAAADSWMRHKTA